MTVCGVIRIGIAETLFIKPVMVCRTALVTRGAEEGSGKMLMLMQIFLTDQIYQPEMLKIGSVIMTGTNVVIYRHLVRLRAMQTGNFPVTVTCA